MKRAKRRGGKSLRPIATILIMAALLAVYYLFPAERHDFEAHFIDVGQGDCALILCGGQSLLIDAGTSDSCDAIINYLRAEGVSELDYIVATHGHADHVGSMAAVIDEFKPNQAYISHHIHATNTYMTVLERLESCNIPTAAPEIGDSFTLGGAVCTFVSGGEGFPDDANNSSLVLMIDYRGDKMLFTGDMETQSEDIILARGDDINADVLKIAHHGSSTSSGQAFLEAVSPDIAVISCGKGNDYGHPHRETLEKLADITLYRTDLEGDIVIASDGEGFFRKESLSWIKKYMS